MPERIVIPDQPLLQYCGRCRDKHEYCDQCNYDTHDCPGCGTAVEHGSHVCEECKATV